MSRVSDSYRRRIQAGEFKPTPEQDNAIFDGYYAFRSGTSRRANPYSGILAAMWRLGFDNAANDAKETQRTPKPGGRKKRKPSQWPLKAKVSA